MRIKERQKVENHWIFRKCQKNTKTKKKQAPPQQLQMI